MTNKDIIINRLKNDLSINEKIAVKLYATMQDALNYNDKARYIYINETSPSNYKREIKSALSAIKRLNNALKSISKNERITLDTLYFEANPNDDVCLQILNEQIRTFKDDEAGIFILSQKIHKALLLANKNLNTLKQGDSKNSAKMNKAGIQILIRDFKEFLPNYVIPTKAHPDSKLYKYIEIWYDYFLNSPLTDIRRHVQNALDDKIANP